MNIKLLSNSRVTGRMRICQYFTRNMVCLFRHVYGTVRDCAACKNGIKSLSLTRGQVQMKVSS